MKKKGTMSIERALVKAEAELRLEGCPTPKWGQDIFKRVNNGHISLEGARSEIKHYVTSRLVNKKYV